MNITDYFEPVDFKDINIGISNENLFINKISVHSKDIPINIEDYQVVILGVCEDRNSDNQGSAAAPDKIREQLYKLFWFKRKLKIADLGNLKTGKTVNDSYYGLREVLIELSSKNIVTVVIGGSQDLTIAMGMAASHLALPLRLVTVDSRIDYSSDKKIPVSRSYLSQIADQNSAMDYVNIGSQVYYIDPAVTDLMEDKLFTTLRVGQIRFNLADAEPYFRFANMASFDIGSVKHADAPGSSQASPNGFVGEEFCQLTRYAGISPDIKVAGFFESNPALDQNNITSSLIAQSIWYFLEGVVLREPETPNDSDNFKRFLVRHPLVDKEMIFFKSNKTARWWIEIPVKGDDPANSIYIPCTYSDYQKACNEEIPARWWYYFQRFN